MAKNSEKNENRRVSLRKVKESAKQKAKQGPKKMAKKSDQDKKAQMDSIREAEFKYMAEVWKAEYEKMLQFQREQEEIKVNRVLDIGYVFRPEEGQLLDYYLRNKIVDKPMELCPIKELDVYGNHPQALTGKFKVWYFFTRSRPNEVQPGTDIEGHWIFGEKEDVFYRDKKVGVKQVVEYCEAGHNSGYKIIEYQLDPAPDNMKTGPWFVCKLYNDVHNGP